MAIGGLSAAAVLIIIDSWYFGMPGGSFVISPLCFILYNLNTSNLGKVYHLCQISNSV